jgi:hypothetical protein
LPSGALAKFVGENQLSGAAMNSRSPSGARWARNVSAHVFGAAGARLVVALLPRRGTLDAPLLRFGERVDHVFAVVVLDEKLGHRTRRKEAVPQDVAGREDRVPQKGGVLRHELVPPLVEAHAVLRVSFGGLEQPFARMEAEVIPTHANGRLIGEFR